MRIPWDYFMGIGYLDPQDCYQVATTILSIPMLVTANTTCLFQRCMHDQTVISFLQDVVCFLNQFLYVENRHIWVGFPIFLYIKHSCSESKAGHLKSSYPPTRDAWDKRLKIGNWMDTLCSDKSIYGIKAQKKSLQQPTSSGIEY